MRGFATGNNSNPGTPADGSPTSVGGAQQRSPTTPAPEPDRPEVEALTPPGYPQPPQTEPIPEFDLNAHLFKEGNNGFQQAQQAPQVPQVPQRQGGAEVPGSDLLSSLSTAASYARPVVTGVGSAKKRKLNNDDFPDLGEDGLDADVAEMLSRDSGNGF